MIGALRRLLGVERRNYTDALLAAQLGAATGETVSAAATAGVQIAAGMVGRALSIAQPDGDMGTLTPEVLEGIGVDLVRAGQSLLLLRVDPAGRPRFLRSGATESTILGGGDPSTWRYSLNVGGPSVTMVVPAVAGEVAHVRWNADSYRPWRGIAPLARASLTGALAANLERSFGHEASIVVGRAIAVAAGTSSKARSGVRIAMNDPAAGRLILPETTRAFGQSQAPAQDWTPHRLGPSFQSADPQIYRAVLSAVLSCCGVPPALADPAAAGPGQRESWRSFLTGCIQPIGALLEAEVSRVLERPVVLKHHRLAAADVASRARAVHVLTEAGVEVGAARELVGW